MSVELCKYDLSEYLLLSGFADNLGCNENVFNFLQKVKMNIFQIFRFPDQTDINFVIFQAVLRYHWWTGRRWKWKYAGSAG